MFACAWSESLERGGAASSGRPTHVPTNARLPLAGRHLERVERRATGVGVLDVHPATARRAGRGLPQAPRDEAAADLDPDALADGRGDLDDRVLDARLGLLERCPLDVERQR